MHTEFEGFTDFIAHDEPFYTASYRDANMVFEEGMKDGRWVALSYNAAGYMMATNPRPEPSFMDTSLFCQPMSFFLNADGQDLISNWQRIDTTDTPTEHGRIIRITLQNTVRPVTALLTTLMDGTGVLVRTVTVTNTGTAPMAIGALAPLAGGVQQMGARQRLDAVGSPYRLGYMHGSTWGTEGDFRWVNLPDAPYQVCGRYRRDRHRHPFCVLENMLSGETFIYQFAFSGGFSFDFDLNQERNGSSALSMQVRMDMPAPVIVLSPGESYESPEVHFGATFGGLDDAVQMMHDHIRRSVMLPPTRGITGWIETGIGPEFHMDRDTTLWAADQAKSLGAEIFFIDAGWYLAPNDEENWWFHCGEWRYNPERYPGGLSEISNRVHNNGMLFGLWMDADRIGPDTPIAKAQPDWIAKNYDGEPNHSGLLNLANPEVCAWMESEITYLIEEYHIDMFRLDHNVEARNAVCRNEVNGYLENTWARYYTNLYAVYARLRAKYPDVIFENCAGGGGRTDLGLVSHFSHTWVTDWQIHPNSVRITNGMTMALPPEYVDRLIGGQNAYLTGDVTTQIRNLLFARPSVGIIRPSFARENPGQADIIRHHVDIYKNFVRPMHPDSRIYHHTPELSSGQPDGACILELAQKDGLKSMLGIFGLSNCADLSLIVRPRGILPGLTYLITYDNTHSTARIPGYVLLQGLPIRLTSALTSELLLIEAEEQRGETGGPRFS